MGATASFTITVQAPSTVGPVTNTATVTSVTPDTNPNNSSTVTTQVTGSDDVSIVKTANASSALVGTQLTYTLTLGNAGPLTAEGVTVTDPLPQGTTYISSQGPPGWTIVDDPTTNTVTATTASLPVGASPSFTVTIQVPSTPGSITNTASVTSTTPDSNLSNNQSSVTTPIDAIPGGPAQQDIPAVQFGTIPIFTKTQLVGGTLSPQIASLAAFVETSYLTLTGAAPSATTLENDVFQMSAGSLTQQQLVSQLYFSGQFIGQEVTNMYQNIMGTAPTSSQLQAGISQLQSGASLTTLEANLLTSAAYLQTHASPDALVAGLDASILGSTPAASAMQLQVQSLGATTWTAYVQSQLASSQAYTQARHGRLRRDHGPRSDGQRTERLGVRLAKRPGDAGPVRAAALQFGRILAVRVPECVSAYKMSVLRAACGAA